MGNALVFFAECSNGFGVVLMFDGKAIGVMQDLMFFGAAREFTFVL